MQHRGQFSSRIDDNVTAPPPNQQHAPSPPALQTENFACSICEKEFYTKKGRDIHERQAHFGREMICCYCLQSIRYRNVRELQKHFELYHADKDYQQYLRPHQCDLCNSRFTTKTGMTVHMMSCRKNGLNGTAYYCAKCPKRVFPTKEKLKNHMLGHKYSSLDAKKNIS